MFIYQRVLSIHIHPVGDPMDPWRYHSYHSYPRDPHLSWVSCQGLQRLVIHGLFCITHRETYQYITNKVYVVSNICQIYVSKMLRISMYTIYISLSLCLYLCMSRFGDFNWHTMTCGNPPSPYRPLPCSQLVSLQPELGRSCHSPRSSPTADPNGNSMGMIMEIYLDDSGIVMDL